MVQDHKVIMVQDHHGPISVLDHKSRPKSPKKQALGYCNFVENQPATQKELPEDLLQPNLMKNDKMSLFYPVFVISILNYAFM